MAKPKAPVEGVYEKNPGSGIWYTRLRVNGKLVRKAIGTHKAAKEYIEKARTIKATGKGVLSTTAKRPARSFEDLDRVGDGTTVGELCDQYLDYINSNGNPAQLTDLVNPAQRVAAIKAKLGGYAATSLRPHEIKDWLIKLGVAPATRNRYKSTLSVIYGLAIDRETLTDNPCKSVKHFTVDTPQPRWMKDREEDKLRAVIQKWIDKTPERFRLQRLYLREHLNEITLGAGTGLRKGNQYGLTWEMIDFGNRTINIPKTKNGEFHVVPMIDDVYDALREQQEILAEIASLTEDKPAKAKTRRKAMGRVFSIVENREWFRKARKEAKLSSHLRWHDLSRHTAGSRLAQGNANLKVIQEVLGHKTLVMAARYSHLDVAHRADSMKVLNRKKR